MPPDLRARCSRAANADTAAPAQLGLDESSDQHKRPLSGGTGKKSDLKSDRAAPALETDIPDYPSGHTTASWEAD
jgi:hypothetical protein